MHAYSQLFEGNVGQLIVSSNVRRSFVRAEALPPINLVIEPRFRRLRRPPRLCSTAVTYHVDHSHRLLVALDTVRGYPVSFGYEPFPVLPRIYYTTRDNEHSHSVELSAEDLVVLRDGGYVMKRTTVDARAGGKPHTHDVYISCESPYNITVVPRDGFVPSGEVFVPFSASVPGGFATATVY